MEHKVNKHGVPYDPDVLLRFARRAVWDYVSQKGIHYDEEYESEACYKAFRAAEAYKPGKTTYTIYEFAYFCTMRCLRSYHRRMYLQKQQCNISDPSALTDIADINVADCNDSSTPSEIAKPGDEKLIAGLIDGDGIPSKIPTRLSRKAYEIQQAKLKRLRNEYKPE